MKNTSINYLKTPRVMMKRQLLLCVLGLFSSFSLFAQKEIAVETIKATRSYPITMPIMIDSVDIKGNKFTDKKMLETSIQFPDQSAFSNTLLAHHKNGYIPLSKAESGHSLQLLSFQMTANRYSKQTLKVKSAGMFEVYVDGKKLFDKTTVQDSIQNAKEAKKEITSHPYLTKTIVIKYLANSKNKVDEGIKICIEQPKKDKTTNIKVTLDGKRPTNLIDMLEGTRVTASSISPDGHFILLAYRSVAKGGKASSYVELVDTENNKTTNLGSGATWWMPTSNALYKTVKKGDKLNLVKVDPETLGEIILSEDIPSGSFRFTPDEKTLLYTVTENFDERKGDLKILGAPDDRQAGYYSKNYIYKYDLASGVKVRLTYGKHSTYINDISADSRYVLFSTRTENITKRPFSTSSMYCIDLTDMSVSNVWRNETFASSARFSPDGKELLILGAPEAFDGIGQDIKKGQIANSYDTQAYIMDMYTKQIKPISKNFNPSINKSYWSKANNMIYFLTTDKDQENVYSYNPKTGAYKLLPLKEEVIRSFSIATKSAKASYTGLGLKNSAKAYSYDLGNGTSILLSDPTKDIFEHLNLAKVEDWNFKASDGTTITGRYYLPPNFSQANKYPMIVYYYGGTTPTNKSFEHPYSAQVYAAMGYVVYVIQPSGTIGFGQEFSARHVNAWGIRTAEDIIEGTKEFVKTHPYVNEKKIGCIGASYGGFMTMYLQTRTDIFAAAISHAGISSIASYWGEGYWGYSYSSGASAHSYPWNNKKMYIEQSPLFNADKINTPLLLLHGTVDTNVPIGESIQMYTALKILGKPVEFIQVKDENHGIAKYERKLEWNYSIYSWFERWLKDDPTWWNELYPSRKD